MNIVILKGRLTKEPSLVFSQSGTAYMSFTIAVDRYKKDGNTTDFIFCTAFSKTAQFIADYFRKGQEILVRGNIKVDTYEKDGNKLSKQTVLVEQVEFAGSKKDNESAGNKESNVDNGNNNIDSEFPF